MTASLDDLTDAVNDLTRSRVNKEPFSYIDGKRTVVHDKHNTHVPSLLEQLQQSLEPGGTGEAGRAVPGSRPSARLDAIDTYMRIDQAVYGWCKTYAETRRWDSLSDRLRALVGAASRMHPDELHDLVREAKRWVTWGKVCTGWEVPPRRPDNTCPLCAVRGGLRVRVGDGVTSTEAAGYCTACGESWDDSTIGLLAEHIRAENGDVSLYSDGAA